MRYAMGVFLIFLPFLINAQPHGGVPGTEKEDEVSLDNGLTGEILIAPTTSSRKSQKATSPEKPSKGVEEKILPNRITSSTLYIIADGPNLERETPDYWALSDALYELIRKKVPGAVVLRIRPFTIESLAKAYVDAKLTKTFDSILLIVNATASAGAKERFQILTGEGTHADPTFRRAILRLGRSLSFREIAGNPPKEGKARIDTILLTSYSGLIDCPSYPGPVFGMSTKTEPRSLATIEKFISEHKKNLKSLFPTTARAWFDEWGTHAKKIDSFGISYTEGFFFCPYQSLKGYLGRKD